MGQTNATFGQAYDIPKELWILVDHIHAVAESLLLFLESLPDAVIPNAFHERCLEHSGSAAEAARIVQNLPLFHKNVFQYLMAFLNHLLRYSASNGLDKNFIATIFGDIILRSRGALQGRKTLPQRPKRTKKKMQFLVHF